MPAHSVESPVPIQSPTSERLVVDGFIGGGWVSVLAGVAGASAAVVGVEAIGTLTGGDCGMLRAIGAGERPIDRYIPSATPPTSSTPAPTINTACTIGPRSR